MRRLLVGVTYTPDVDAPGRFEAARDKLGRIAPWWFDGEGRLTGAIHFSYAGVGRGGAGFRRRRNLSFIAGLPATSRFAVDSALSWAVHFRTAWRLGRRRGGVTVLAPQPEQGIGAALAKVVLGDRVRLVVRVIGHTAGRALYDRESRVLYHVLERIERFVLRRADLVLPMGEFTRRLAIDDGADPDRVVLFPVGVPWADRARVTPIRGRPTVLYAGWLERGKGVQVLLRAMRRVAERVPDAELRLAGDGPYRGRLEALAGELGITGRVRFLGWIEPAAMSTAYRDAWVVVLPSIWEEGLGMVLIEGGLMGRPLVGSDRGGIRDAVRHGENGFLFPPGDDAALADALVRLLEDPSAASAMGRRARETARAYLDRRPAALERARAVLEDLVGGVGAPGVGRS